MPYVTPEDNHDYSSTTTLTAPYLCLAEKQCVKNNDLPLDAIGNTIEINLLQMNDEAEIPTKILPARHYQLT
ncbi:hypothetical protein ABJ851_002764 [Shigella flexneri]|nr:hypothetical protein [Escherichia coli]